MEEFVTIIANGITMIVPAKEASLYTRAGYKIVESAPVEDADKPADKPAKSPKK